MVCFFQTAAGIKQAVCFVRDLYVDSKVLVSFQKSKNLIGKVVYINPAAFSFKMMCSNMVFPPTVTKALGRVSVIGLSRLPSPAAKIIAFIMFFQMFVLYSAHGV